MTDLTNKSEDSFREADPDVLHQHVFENATKGDPCSVLKTIDEYCYKFATRTMNVGDTKGVIVDNIFKERDPTVAIELGSYIGYSAVRMARHLKMGGKLYCIEIVPHYAKLVENLVEFAGLSDKVTVIVGSAKEAIPTLKQKFGIKKIDFVFIDHEKDSYKPDLIRLVDSGLLQKGSVVLADNILYPGSPEYAEYMRGHPKFDSTFIESNLEYRPDVKDGLEKSIYMG